MLGTMLPPAQLPRSPRPERRIRSTSPSGRFAHNAYRSRSPSPRGRRARGGTNSSGSGSASASSGRGSGDESCRQRNSPENDAKWERQLDTLLADLQNSIGQQQVRMSHESSPAQHRKTHSPFLSQESSPAQHRKNRSPQPASAPRRRPGSPGQYTEVVTETTRSVHREATPPPEQEPTGAAPRTTSGNIRELDALLNDLNDARNSGTAAFSSARDGGPVQQSGQVTVRDPPWASAVGLDIVSSPNAKTYETRTVEVTESVPEGRQASSSATQELDDLMASLSDFTIHATSYQRTVVEEKNEVPNKPEKAEQLDNMLGSLQEDMSKQGVDTTNKGTCAACDMPIAGQVITALGKTWHVEHFTCAHCNQELGNRNFFERNGEPYCEDDYHNLFSPRCAACEGPILDKCVTAMQQTWHPEHFVCAQCGVPFGDGSFHERDGRPYCRDDYFGLFAPRCGGCEQPVMENYISALNAQWHSECFVCKDCQRPFENGSFFDYEGHPYCETHYHAKRGSLCASCHKPITGRCVTAMFKKFHPEHFSCSFCLKQLNKGTFKEQEDKPYCHQCFDKLFG